MSIEELIRTIQYTQDCVALSRNGLPKISGNGLALPADVQEFYHLCGGVGLFQSAAYAIIIVPPQNVVPANPVIIGEQIEDDVSSCWYIIAKGDNRECLTIDLSEARLGRCYDSFYDLHPGNSPIIAFSFTELLTSLLRNQGQHWYWLRDEKFNLGNAYDYVV